MRRQVVTKSGADHASDAMSLDMWGARADHVFVTLEGATLHCALVGEGPPIVLLHGFTGAATDWSGVFPEGIAGYRLIVPDLRGHGHSSSAGGEFTHRQSALDVFDVLDSLGVDTFVGMGLSCGGNTLLHMATQQPARVAAMVNVSGTAYFPPEARAFQAAYTPENTPPEEWGRLRGSHPGGDAQILELIRIGNAFKDSYTDLNFTGPLLSTISARTLIVYGDRDPLYPCRIALEMYEAIPNASLWVLPDAGHVPVGGDQLDGFLAKALPFLGVA